MRLAAGTGRFPANSRAASAILEKAGSGEYGPQPPQWTEALRLFDEGFRELLPNFGDYGDVSSQFENFIEGVMAGDIIWLESWKLNSAVKKQRASERNTEGGRI